MTYDEDLYYKALQLAQQGQTQGPGLYARPGGTEGVRMMNVSQLTPEQIQQIEMIKQYGVPYQLDSNKTKTQRDADNAYNSLRNFFGNTLMGREWMDKYYGGNP